MKKGIIYIVLLILLIIGVVGYIIYGKDETLVSKLDNSKDWVYDAEYEKNVFAESYQTDHGTMAYASEIVVPFINVDSTYASESNNEIKTVFDSAVEAYNDGYSDRMLYIDECSYTKYFENDYLSVALVFGVGATDVPSHSYYTYNVDLKTGNELSYMDIYELVGLNNSNITSKVELAIENKLKDILGDYSNEYRYFDTAKNESVNNYNESVNNNTIQYFLSEDKKLNIIVKLSLPGIGAEYSFHVVTID